MSVIFEIHIGGLFGGQIRIDRNRSSVVPSNTCGIRWSEPWAYYWYNNNPGNVVNSLPSSENPNQPEISFTGPYGSCGGNYNFPPPLTQNGLAPFDLATTLVVQVASMSDVEFLDSNGFEIPIPEFPEDPDIPSLEEICEEIPECCEQPDDFTIELPPPDFSKPEQKDLAIVSTLIFRKSEFTRSAVLYLKALHSLVKQTGISHLNNTTCKNLLKTAKKRLQTAIAFEKKLKDHLEKSSFNGGCSTQDNLERRVIQNILVGVQLDSIITQRISNTLCAFSGELSRDVSDHLKTIMRDTLRSSSTLDSAFYQVEIARNLLLPLKAHRK